MNREKKINKGKIILGILLIVLIFLILFITAKLKATFPGVTGIPLENNVENVGILKDRAVVLDGNTLRGYNEKSAEIFSTKVSVDQGKLVSSSDRIYIAEGKKILILDKKGKLLKEIELPMTCKYLDFENDGVIVQGESMQVAFNRDGKTIGSAVSDDGIMSENSVSLKGTYSVFSSLNVNNNRIYSSLYLIDKDGNQIMKQVLYDEIIQFIKFISDEKYIVGTNNHIYIFKKEAIDSLVNVNKLKAMDVTEDNIFIIDEDDLIVYDFNFKQVDKLSLRTEYKKMKATDKNLILYNDKNFAKYEVGKLIESTSTKEIQAIKTYKNNLYLIFEDSIDRIN